MSFLDAWMQDISALTLSAIGLMAVAGLIVGVAPSSYPLLAVGAGISAGSTADAPIRRTRAMFLAAGFVLGIATVDAALGALFGLLGFVVLEVLATLMTPVYFALSLLLLVMGLALLRVITIDLRVLYATPKAAVNGGAKLVHPGGAKLVHLTLCGTRCWGVVPVVHRRDPRCFV